MLKLIFSLLPYWIIAYYLWTILPSRLFAIGWLGTLYLSAAVVLATRGKRILFALSKDPWIVLLIILSGLSCFWSVDVSTTFASFRSLIVQYILVGYLVTTYSLKTIINLTGKTLCSMGVLSALYIAFLPQASKSGLYGNSFWFGVFPHQSVLAGTMALAVVSALYAFFIERKKIKSNLSRIFILSVIGLCMYLLLFCGAKTALLGLVGSFSILPFFFLKQLKGMRTRNLFFVSLLYIFCIGLPTLYIFQEFIVVEILNKSPSLSGRSYLWEHLSERIMERPYGYGLNAFWFDKELVEGTVTATGYTYGNSHSNYYDLLLGVGFPGVLLLLCSLATVIKRSVTLAFNYGLIEFRWALQVIIILLVASYSDVFIGFLAARTIGWFIFCVISIKSSLVLEKLRETSTDKNHYYSIYRSRHSQLS